MELLEFLDTFPHFDFDIPDADGETPIFYAISSKRFDMVKFLVAHGVSLSHKSIKNEWTPVYVAATLGNEEILKYLIELGCDINVQTGIKRTALTKACWMGKTETVKVLLSHPKIDIEHKANSDRTALHMAVWGPYGGRQGKKMGNNPTDSPECVKLLLQAGANPNSRDTGGKTPLITAC